MEPPGSTKPEGGKAEALTKKRKSCKDDEKAYQPYYLHRTLGGHTGAIASVHFSPDGEWLASASGDSTVCLWSWRDGSVVHTFKGHGAGVSDVAWSKDGKYLASASDDKTIKLWSVADKKLINTLQGHTSYVMCVDFNHKGNMLVSGSHDETVRLWELKTGACIGVLPAHSDPVTAVAFHPDGTIIASCSFDGLIRLWNTSNGTCLRTMMTDDNPAASSVKFTPNGKFILAGYLDGRLRLWDYCATEKSKVKRVYEGHVNNNFCFFSSFLCQEPYSEGDMPKSKYVLSGSEDGAVFVWHVPTKKVVQKIAGRKSEEEEGDGHCGAVLATDSNHRAGVFVTGSREPDNTIKLWTKAPTAPGQRKSE